MRQRRVHVRLVVLVPFILGGVSMLAGLIMNQAWHWLCPDGLADDRVFVVALAGGLAVFGAAMAFAVLIRRPLRRLLATADRTLPQPAAVHGDEQSEFGRLDAVVTHVTEVLGALEAKALFPEMVGESRAMREVFTCILKVAPTATTVLLTGESGTGKELAARAIHAKSSYAKGPFVAVNCAAIPEGLLESELFGHEKGAFTGAVARQIGRFEQAGGGTLFLDEIGDMPLALQGKLLRVIETREVMRLGGRRPVRLTGRLVAATNRDLAELQRQGAFRQDLLHRLNEFPLCLPPLRERREDIALLAERFLDAGGKHGALSVEVLQHLLAYDWPGNVRELKNVVTRAAVLAGDAPIGVVHLAGLVAAQGPPAEIAPRCDLDDKLAAYEKSMVEAALARSGGVQARAAVLLGIKERSLWHRVKKLGIRPRDFKAGREKG